MSSVCISPPGEESIRSYCVIFQCVSSASLYTIADVRIYLCVDVTGSTENRACYTVTAPAGLR